MTEHLLNQSKGLAGRYMAEEINSQPASWRTALDMREERTLLPHPGERVAVIGCGTSWFAAQSYAALREASGQGETDAFAASEAVLDRPYDTIIAISRSGTTTEILDIAGRKPRTSRMIAVVGDTTSPLVDLVDDVIPLAFADERSVVQTRFPTTFLAFVRSALGENLDAAITDAEAALDEELDEALVSAERYAFLGTGWTLGLAHEAALKMRESAQSWSESYPAMEYRHGPISIASNSGVTWMFGQVPSGLRGEVESTGALFVHSDRDPLADLIVAQRVALARSLALGLNPDAPRNLTRSVVLVP